MYIREGNLGVYPSLRSRIGPTGASRARSLGIVFSGFGPPARRAGGFRGVGLFLSGCAFVSGFRAVFFTFGLLRRKAGCGRVSGWPHPAGRPTLRRRLAGGGALVFRT